MNMKELINRATSDFIHTMRLCDVQIGTVKTINPITIQLENNKVLPVDFFVFTSRTNFLQVNKNAEDIGKKVVILQKTGGQKYFVIDYIVEEESL